MKNKRLWVSLLAGFLAAVLLLSLILSALPRASAASSSEIKNQIEKLEQQQQELEGKIEDLKNQQSGNVSEAKDLMAEKNLIDQQIGLLHTQISNLNEQIAAYSLLIADKQEDLEAAQERLAELNRKNKERIRAMEEDGSLSYWSVLFKANSFSDLLDRLNMIEEIAASDRRRLDEMSAAAKVVEEAKVELEAEKLLLEENRKELAAKQTELESKAQDAQNLLAQLLAKGEEFDRLMEQYEEEQKEFIDEISQKEKDYDDAKYQEWLATSVPPTTKPPVVSSGGVGGSAVGSSGATWLVPCDYSVVTSPYGPRVHPITGEVGKMHHGVDLSGYAISGKPIYATRSGIVSLAGWYGSGGWTVSIDHRDGYETFYMHMTNYIVNKGDYVTAGQVIGYVGSSGGSTGPHLHFEVRLNGESVNPMLFIG